MSCECGQPEPCKYHDVRPEAATAMRLLLKLDPEERARIFCRFCHQCGVEIGAGELNKIGTINPCICRSCEERNESES